MSALIEIDDMTFGYRRGEFHLRVDSLRIDAGQKAVFIGPSGSGKTTLLHLAAGILLPKSGKIRVAGEEISNRSDGWRMVTWQSTRLP